MLRGPRRRGVICCRMRRHASTVDSTACGNVSDIQICANSHSLAMPLPDYRLWIDLHNSRSGGDDDSGPLTGNEREGWHNWVWRNWAEAAGLRRARYAYGCGHRARLYEIRRRAEGRSARLPPYGLARSKSSAAKWNRRAERDSRASGTEGVAVPDRQHVVRQRARREAAPSDRADLFPTRPEAGGGGGSPVSSFRHLPTPPHRGARSPRALALGKPACSDGSACAAGH